MKDTLIQTARDYYPGIMKDAVECHEDGCMGLIIRLADGEVIQYDALEHTIRTLPPNSDALSEIECRREFAMRLRRIMYLKGVNQQYLSEATGITAVTLSNYMRGKVTPNFYNVDKIAKALDCSIEEFRYTY
jgi:DNA-binding Xre family transcriptional regulator